MAFVFGEEKKANPKPSKIRMKTKVTRLVLLVINIRKINPKVDNAIPMDAIIRGSNLSDNLPAIGAKMDMIIGEATKISPASRGFKALIY